MSLWRFQRRDRLEAVIAREAAHMLSARVPRVTPPQGQDDFFLRR